MNYYEGNIKRKILILFCKINFSIFCFFFPSLIFAQGEFNNWYFGQHAGLNFTSGTPVVLNNCSPLFSDEYTTATVSDSLSNLWFYAMYSAVFNRNNAIMPNGSGLLSSGPANQPLLPVQKLDDDSSYYLFTIDVTPNLSDPNHNGLRYSIIDMRLNGGLGDIVTGEKNLPIPEAGQTSNMLSGSRHHNNHDVWIVVRKYTTKNYLSYLITHAGIDTLPVISNSLIQEGAPLFSNDAVILKISPDGSKLVCLYDTVAEYCDFNDSTGVITPLFCFKSQTNIPLYFDGSAEFSIDSKYLYISGSINGNYGHIWQYDATKTDSSEFKQSEVSIYSPGYLVVNTTFGLQRGPDNKIYCTVQLKDSLSVINNPTIQGSGCNFQKDVICLLNTNLSYWGFPQFIERYKAYIHHTGICQKDSINFAGDIWPIADSIHWDFGDPGSGSADFSNLPNPSHIYSSPGVYTVELFVKHIDHRTDTAWQVVNIIASPQPNLGPDQTTCIGDSVTFDADACSGCTYLWKNLGTGLPVGNSQTFRTGQPGTYDVTVTNTTGCNGMDTVQLITTSVPSVTNNPLSKTICSGDSTHIILISNVSGTMFHWTASLTSGNITGFSADSGHIINQVLTDNLAIPGVVTYHITPKVGSCSGATVDYPVTVTPGDSVKVSITASTNNICAGIQITFTATPSNPGTIPIYQWKVNGINSGTNSTTFTYTPLNGDVVTCVLTSSLTSCISNNPAVSNSLLMVIDSILVVGITINPSANPVCARNSVTYTATPTNGGVSPIYQWKVNGVGVGTNNPTYSYIPNNGDIVTCVLTSNATCPAGNPATSPPITMTVNPNLAVSVSIVASANPFCQGAAVTFTATPVNGGGLATYQWQVNGVNVGTSSPNYTYNPLNGDLVTCVLTSSIACPVGSPATSNTITMIVNSNLPAGVTIVASSNPFCPGSAVTFTATPVNGGTIPAYQWKVNGVNAGTNSHIFTYNPANGDSVRCVMTSNLACVTSNPASSVEIIMSGTLAPIVTFTSCFDTITTVNAKPIKLKGGIPLGGTYSGPGVNSLTGIFNPATAGVGTKTITYTFTNAVLCTASKSIHVMVQAAPVFTCGNNLIDIRDNKVYPTVQLGSQCWLASNLNFGTIIASTQDQRDNCVSEKYCYNDNPLNCTNQGGLYQWDELMQYDATPADQGFCPPAWHIPTENDWNTLFTNYINNGFAGSPLKFSGYSGFNALLSGARHIDKSWDFQGFATFFWSSTQEGTTKAWAHGMNDPDPSVSVYPASRANAFSIRCIHD